MNFEDCNRSVLHGAASLNDIYVPKNVYYILIYKTNYYKVMDNIDKALMQEFMSFDSFKTNFILDKDNDIIRIQHPKKFKIKYFYNFENNITNILITLDNGISTTLVNIYKALLSDTYDKILNGTIVKNTGFCLLKISNNTFRLVKNKQQKLNSYKEKHKLKPKIVSKDPMQVNDKSFEITYIEHHDKFYSEFVFNGKVVKYGPYNKKKIAVHETRQEIIKNLKLINSSR